MQFPKSMHAEGWRDQMPAQRTLPPIPVVSRDADARSPSLHSRHLHLVALLVAVVTLGSAAGLDMVDDPRPLDVQASAAMHKAGEALQDWQGQLSRGLQVSLRAVADGRDVDATVLARAEPAAASGEDRAQAVGAAEITPNLPATPVR